MIAVPAADKARLLAEALPYIRRYHGKTIVVKYGGNAMTEPPLQAALAKDVALLKLVGVNPVVVHGAGPQITLALDRLGMESNFIDGLRVTDDATMEVVEMVLGGTVNQHIVQLINREGGQAAGLTGKDGGLLRAKCLGEKTGRVGEVSFVTPRVLSLLYSNGFIPVIAPIGVDDAGRSLNINADTAAAEIAVALQAEALLLLTNTAGVRDENQQLIPSLAAAAAEKMISDGVIRGGMRPKVQCALRAVEGGVPSCRIINGAAMHSLLLEVLTDEGAGTLLSP